MPTRLSRTPRRSAAARGRYTTAVTSSAVDLSSSTTTRTPVSSSPSIRNLTGVDVCPASRLNLLQLAPGGHMDRLCIWAVKSAFGQLGTIYGTQSGPSSTNNKPLGKSAYTPPKSMMANPDVGRILNSDEVQSVVNAAKPPTDFKSNKNKPNTAKNAEALAALSLCAAKKYRTQPDPFFL